MWNRGSSYSPSIWFYSQLPLLPLSHFFQPSTLPILLWFSRFLVYHSSLYPEISIPVQFSFLYLLFNRCLFCSLPYFIILNFILPLKIHCKHQFTSTWSELSVNSVIFHISHLYNSTDLTFVLKNWILFLIKIFLFIQTGYNCMKPSFAFLIWLWTSSKAPPCIVTMLPRDVKDFNCSTSLPFIAVPDMY
jgi:hypothetical protein